MWGPDLLIYLEESILCLQFRQAELEGLRSSWWGHSGGLKQSQAQRKSCAGAAVGFIHCQHHVISSRQFFRTLSPPSIRFSFFFFVLKMMSSHWRSSRCFCVSKLRVLVLGESRLRLHGCSPLLRHVGTAFVAVGLFRAPFVSVSTQRWGVGVRALAGTVETCNWSSFEQRDSKEWDHRDQAALFVFVLHVKKAVLFSIFLDIHNARYCYWKPCKRNKICSIRACSNSCLIFL